MAATQSPARPRIAAKGSRSAEYHLAAIATDVQNSKIEVARLNDKTAKLDDLRVSLQKTDSDLSVLLQKATDHVDEISALRAKVNKVEIIEGKYGTEIGTLGFRLSTLELDHKNQCAALAQLRERVAALEATNKANAKE